MNSETNNITNFISSASNNYQFKHIPMKYFPPFLKKIDKESKAEKSSNLPFTQLNLLNDHTYDEFIQEFTQLSQSTAERQIKTFYFVRHAQGIHNEAESTFGTLHWETVQAKSEQYFDAKLTEFGRNQTKLLFDSITKMQQSTPTLKFDLLIVSPLSRAIETAQIAFQHLFDNPKFSIYSHEMIRETIGRHYCDKRRSITELKQLYPRINFSEPGAFNSDSDVLWNTNERETSKQIQLRAIKFLNWCFDRFPDEKHIIVMAHSGIISTCARILGANDSMQEEVIGNEDEYEFAIANCEFLPIVAVRCKKEKIIIKAETENLSTMNNSV
jgi:broad specificity phosphatase PhoE